MFIYFGMGLISLVILPVLNVGAFYIFTRWAPYAIDRFPYQDFMVNVELPGQKKCAYHQCPWFDILHPTRKREIYYQIQKLGKDWRDPEKKHQVRTNILRMLEGTQARGWQIESRQIPKILPKMFEVEVLGSGSVGSPKEEW